MTTEAQRAYAELCVAEPSRLASWGDSRTEPIQAPSTVRFHLMDVTQFVWVRSGAIDVQLADGSTRRLVEDDCVFWGPDEEFEFRTVPRVYSETTEAAGDAVLQVQALTQ